MKYTVYLENGQILWTGDCPESELENQISGTQLLLPIDSDPGTQYVENGVLVDLPPKPQTGAYSFNYSSKTWETQTSLQIQNVKSRRNYLLTQSDWTQITNNPLTAEKQQQWAIYRQALRDVPAQSGYPYSVTWPTIPA
jgi:hypothetical protein